MDNKVSDDLKVIAQQVADEMRRLSKTAWGPKQLGPLLRLLPTLECAISATKVHWVEKPIRDKP